MMDRYYYLVAQLPGLQFEREPLISGEVFLEEAGKWLGRSALETLRQVHLYDLSPEPTPSALYNRFKAFERDFRAELAGWRRALREETDLKLSFPSSLVREGNPLEVERKLLKYRWDRLEEEERGHYFDLETLIVYHLKLQILARLAGYDGERGFRVFRTIKPILLPGLKPGVYPGLILSGALYPDLKIGVGRRERISGHMEQRT
jgi:hypothetical protein